MLCVPTCVATSGVTGLAAAGVKFWVSSSKCAVLSTCFPFKFFSYSDQGRTWLKLVLLSQNILMLNDDLKDEKMERPNRDKSTLEELSLVTSKIQSQNNMSKTHNTYIM